MEEKEAKENKEEGQGRKEEEEDTDTAAKSSMAAASLEVSQQFRTLLNADDVENLKNFQLLILGRLQDSNAVLSHFNEYSERSFAAVASDFSRNARLLKSMKSDLDHIFQKLRSMKAKIMKYSPEALESSSGSNILDERPDLEAPLSTENDIKATKLP